MKFLEVCYFDFRRLRGEVTVNGPRKTSYFHGVKYCYPFKWPFFERFFFGPSCSNVATRV